MAIPRAPERAVRQSRHASGYARDAIASYFVFKTLREKGLLPAGLRFQISIPMVNSVVRGHYFPDPKDVERIRPGFEDALAAELDVIVKHIPAKDLAIQCLGLRKRVRLFRR